MLKKISSLLFVFFLTFQSPILAAPQNVSGSSVVYLDADGVLDGASFTGQATVPSTLFVPLNLEVNINENAVGVVTDQFAVGTLEFEGNSLVSGSVGTFGGNPLGTIQTGNADVIFSSDLSAQTFGLNANTVVVNGVLTLPLGTATLNSMFLSNDAYGHIQINGASLATINASEVIVNIDASRALDLADDQLFTVISAPMGTTGVPVTLTSNNVRYVFSLENIVGTDNGSIFIRSTRVPISKLVTNKNAKSVGAVLDKALPFAGAYPDSDLAFVESELGFSTTKAFQNAVLQISAAPGLMGVARESFNTTRQFQKVWLKHLQRERLFLSCCSMGSNDWGNNFCNWEWNPFKVWTDGFVYYGHQGNKDDYNGYDVHTWGTVIAAETPLVCDFRGGLGFGYAYSKIKENIYDGNTGTHNYQGTAYFTYHPDSSFLDGGVSFGWNHYSGTRKIRYNSVDRSAYAKYNGQEYSTFLAAGWSHFHDDFEITPLASLLYSYLHLCDYREHGAKSLNLQVRTQNYQFLQSSLGAKVAYLFDSCYGTFVPEIHSFWLYDFNPATLDARASLQYLGAPGGSFKNKGFRVDQNMWNIGGSLSCAPIEPLTITLSYDYERSSHYYDHQGLLELALEF